MAEITTLEGKIVMPSRSIDYERLRPITQEEAKAISPIVEEEFNRIREKLRKEDERFLSSKPREETARQSFRRRLHVILERIRNS